MKLNTKQIEVVKAKLEDKFSFSKIKKEYGVPKSTAQGWIKKYLDSEENDEPVGHVNDNLERVTNNKVIRTEEHIEDVFQNLAPIKFPAPKRKQVKQELSDYVVVAGDFHFPLECEKSVEIFLQVVDELNPKSVILNGDTVDLLAVSRYPKDIRKNYTLLEEREAYHNFLYRLLEVTSEDTKIYETSANHSGNGVEGRWWRYLSNQLGDLASLPEIQESLSYQEVFLGEFQDKVEYVDYVELAKDFIILHGDVVRKNGGYSARGMLEKWFTSLMHNHTHRLGMTGQRIPSLGSRNNQQFLAWENGCMCDLNPVYGSAMNWQNGFSIVSVKDDVFGVEPISINDGVANIVTLGKVLRV